MPRVPRMYLNTEYFHVITQGINKSYIFEESIDIKFYIKKMHELNKNIDDGYIFIDVNDEKDSFINKVINNFLMEHQYNLKTLVKNEKELYKLILILKRDYKVSLKKISDLINVNREKVRKIYNNK